MGVSQTDDSALKGRIFKGGGGVGGEHHKRRGRELSRGVWGVWKCIVCNWRPPIHRTHGSVTYLSFTTKIWATTEADYILKVVW